jgi:DnaJ-class molecular chaperone
VRISFSKRRIILKKDYYTILTIEHDASEKEIKKAYRRLALRYHPDINNGDQETEDRFKEINEAYSVLSDREQRMRYDTFGHFSPQGQGSYGSPFNAAFARAHSGFKGGFCRRRGRDMDMGRAFGRGGCGMGGFAQAFSSVNRNRFAKPSNRTVQAIPLTAEEARSGTEKEILLTTGGTTQSVTIRIPPGISDKAILLMKAEELAKDEGDLYFQINING